MKVVVTSNDTVRRNLWDADGWEMRELLPQGQERAMYSVVQTYANRLPAALPEAELRRLRCSLKPVGLPRQMTLCGADISIRTVYFLESGLASIVTPKERTVEVGLVGHEGFIGVPLLLGLNSSPFRTFMQAQARAFPCIAINL